MRAHIITVLIKTTDRVRSTYARFDDICSIKETPLYAHPCASYAFISRPITDVRVFVCVQKRGTPKKTATVQV